MFYFKCWTKWMNGFEHTYEVCGSHRKGEKERKYLSGFSQIVDFTVEEIVEKRSDYEIAPEDRVVEDMSIQGMIEGEKKDRKERIKARMGEQKTEEKETEVKPEPKPEPKKAKPKSGRRRKRRVVVEDDSKYTGTIDDF